MGIQHHFESVCGSPIWNFKTVYSKYPDFTICFHYTVLKWMPCFVLWMAAPFWTYMLTNTVKYSLRLSILSILKMVTTILLIIIEAIHLYNAFENSKYLVFYMTPLIFIVTYILVLFFNHFERIKGQRSSSLVFCFWAFLVFNSSITLRSKILDQYYSNTHFEIVDIYLFYAFYALICFNMVLSAFSEKFTKKNQKYFKENKKKQSPENVASLLSRLLFTWMDKIIKQGFDKNINKDDIWDIDASESAEFVANKFEKVWNKESQIYIQNLKKSSINKFSAAYKHNLNANDEELILNRAFSEIELTMRDGKKPSLFFCLFKVFGGKFLAGTILKLVSDVLSYAGPVILHLIINFIKDSNQIMSVGLFLTALLFFTTFTQSLLVQHYFIRMYLVGQRMRTALILLIYKKSLRLSPTAKKSSTAGEMTNLISINAQMFQNFTPFLNMIWSSPLQIVICIYILWRYLGIAAFAGFATTIIFIPLNVFTAKKSKKLCDKKLKSQDHRLKILNEILSGIKVIKFYGWEVPFQNLVDKIREDEMKYYSYNAYYGIISSFTWSCAPFLVAGVSFASFVLISEDNILDPGTAFVSLTVFYLIRFPLAMLPATISLIIQANISMQRIRNFLLLDEINENDVEKDEHSDVAIATKNLNLGWSLNEPCLFNLNIEIKKGKLIAIVGKVGSGKSSLLSGFLGEMHKLNYGQLHLNGRTAYVAQQAWIQNETARENILFGKEYDEKFYNKIIQACSLVVDFNIMPGADSTEIGEKGINLSGGQKQRISLARAVYSDLDIYLLDDPLSAVDAHVGKSMFDQVIGPNGILKDKTRVFATNSLSFLPQCDGIIMLENGTVSESGTFEELKNKNGSFARFIKLYLENNEANKENIKNQQEEEMNKLNSMKRKIPMMQKCDSLGSGSIDIEDNEEHELKELIVCEKNIIDKEKFYQGTIKLSILIDYIKKCSVSLTVVFSIFFTSSIIGLAASSFWLSEWSNDSVDPIKAEENKYFRLSVYLGLGFLQCGLLMIANILLVIMFIKGARFLHKKLLSSILRSTLHFFESTPTGRITNRFSKDIEALETAIPDSFKIVIFCLSNILNTLIIVSYSTPYVLFFLVPIFFIYTFIQRYFVATSRQLARMDSVTKSPIFSHFSETIAGVSTLRAYACQDRFINKMQRNIDDNNIYVLITNFADRWLGLRLELIGAVITALSSLFAVFSRNTLSPGLVGLSISLSLSISQALNFFVRMGADLEANITALERMKEMCEVPAEAEWKNDNTRPDDSWPAEGGIRFENYSVKYREELDYVLKDISTEILPGEKIGIIGRTGAGKSSLFLGLFRMLEKNIGDIFIDDVNISRIGLHDLRHKLTIIPQDPIIFCGTIRMNLDPFEKYTDEQLWIALELAHLKDFVLESKHQLDLICSEGGENLSVGQRQLLCLARALLRKSKILILDEATASVDHNTDELIQNTIRSQFSDCTVLTIAHRLNTIMDSSRIMVLDKGKIAEFDSPKLLLKNKMGLFYVMAKEAGLI